MAIITVSRGTYTGSRQVVVPLAERLGYRTVSRGQLYSHAENRYGVAREDVVRAMERAPTIKELAKGRDGNGEELAHWRQRMFWYLQASLCDLLGGDDVVYHGQAGHLLLPGLSHVVRVRIIAPLEARIEMAIERAGDTEREATVRIERVDSERSKWTRRLFGVDWAAPDSYDMVLNLERLDVHDLASQIAVTAHLPAFEATVDSMQAFRDLHLRSRIMAQLYKEASVELTGVSIGVQKGEVRVFQGGSGPVGDRIRALAAEHRSACGA